MILMDFMGEGGHITKGGDAGTAKGKGLTEGGLSEFLSIPKRTRREFQKLTVAFISCQNWHFPLLNKTMQTREKALYDKYQWRQMP